MQKSGLKEFFSHKQSYLGHLVTFCKSELHQPGTKTKINLNWQDMHEDLLHDL